MNIINAITNVLPIVSIFTSAIGAWVGYRLAVQALQLKVQEMSEKIKESEKVIEALRSYTDARFINEVLPLVNRIQSIEIAMARLSEQVVGGFATTNVNLEFIKDFIKRLSEK